MPNIYHTNLFKPRKFNTRKEFTKRVIEYFDFCYDPDPQKCRPLTLSGLALFLGMHRNTLKTYGEDEKYADIVEKAKAIIETQLDERVSSNLGTSSNQFVLKENFGWKAGGVGEGQVGGDKTNITVNLTKININSLPEDDKVRFLTGRLTAQEINKIAEPKRLQ